MYYNYLIQERKNIEKSPTSNSLAYDYYLQARTIWNSLTHLSTEQLAHANQLFDKARELDPNFILAYSDQVEMNLMDYYSHHISLRTPALDKTDSLISDMNQIAPNSPETQFAHGNYQYFVNPMIHNYLLLSNHSPKHSLEKMLLRSLSSRVKMKEMWRMYYQDIKT